MPSQRRLGLLLLASILSITPLLALTAPAHAGASTPVPSPTTPAPTVVRIGAYVVNLGDFNVGQGTFNADFYLWFSWQGTWANATGSAAGFPSAFELMNGVIDKSTLIEADQNISGTGQNYMIYRIEAQMSDPINLQSYPFDRHVLTIEVEDQDHNESSLVYLADEETRLDSLVQLQGWDIRSSGVSAAVIDHFYNTTFGYPGQNVYETYSRFIVSIPIGRPVFPAVVQTFIPIILILIVAMTSFHIKMDQFGTRLSLNVVTLLTAAAFQISLTSNIPQFGFLTLADRLLIGVYCLLVYSLVITVAQHALRVGRTLDAVKRLEESNWIIFPAAAALLVVVQFLI